MEKITQEFQFIVWYLSSIYYLPNSYIFFDLLLVSYVLSKSSETFLNYQKILFLIKNYRNLNLFKSFVFKGVFKSKF